MHTLYYQQIIKKAVNFARKQSCSSYVQMAGKSSGLNHQDNPLNLTLKT